MLTRIKKLYHEEAYTLLCWLAYARSPPTLAQLVEAAITDPDQESCIDTDERGGLRDTLRILSGLVTIEENQDADAESQWEPGQSTYDASTAGNHQGDALTRDLSITPQTRVRLAHFSVKEYLESSRILTSEASRFHLESVTGHRFLAQSCLTYLRHYSVSSEKASNQSDLEIFPLLQYAAESWFHHCALQQGVGEASRELTFLQQDYARRHWRLVHDPDQYWDGPFEYRSKHLPSAIYYASLLGLGPVVSSLLSSRADVNAQGGRYGNALQAALAKGHKGTVQLLLDNGAYVNTQGGLYGSALQTASAVGNKEIVQLLLDNGANINAQGGRYGNALQAALANGYKGIVQLLLDNGAYVNAQGGRYGSALQAASVRGYKEMVQLLLDTGADINAQGGLYGNALQAASATGYKEVVQLLQASGAVYSPPDADRLAEPNN